MKHTDNTFNLMLESRVEHGTCNLKQTSQVHAYLISKLWWTKAQNSQLYKKES